MTNRFSPNPPPSAFSPQAVTDALKEENRSLFKKGDPTETGQVDFQGLKNIFAVSPMKLDVKIIARLFAEIDKDSDGNITREEFSSFFDPKAAKSTWEIFRTNDLDTDGFLAIHEAYGALLELGLLDISERGVEFLVSTLTDEKKICYEMFCRITNRASIFICRLKQPPTEQPATWREKISAINTMFCAFVIGLFSFFPKPTSLPFKIADLKIPFVSQPSKTKNDNFFDVVTLLLLSTWAVIFIVSLQTRSHEQLGKPLDLLTIFFAFLSVCSLIYYLNGILALVPIAVAALFGIILAVKKCGDIRTWPRIVWSFIRRLVLFLNE